MKWHECVDKSELKEIGCFSDVKEIIADDLKGKMKITARSWQELYEKISLLQLLFSRTKPEKLWFDGFETEAQKYLFCLTQIDGKNRQKNLGVSGLHYKNKDLAKKWKQKIAQKIHPDKCSDSRAKEAINILDSMFQEMTK